MRRFAFTLIALLTLGDPGYAGAQQYPWERLPATPSLPKPEQSGIAAVNDYRTQHGKDAVVGRVGSAAQDCALHNGSGCTGGWAETEVPKLDGAAAVQKILPFAHLLNDMKDFQIGWAYDPGAKMYYFAIVRND